MHDTVCRSVVVDGTSQVLLMLIEILSTMFRATLRWVVIATGGSRAAPNGAGQADTSRALTVIRIHFDHPMSQIMVRKSGILHLSFATA